MTFRDLRTKAGFTQVTLAEAVGLDQSAISQLELGRVESPLYSTVEALAKALKVSEQDVAKALKKTRAMAAA